MGAEVSCPQKEGGLDSRLLEMTHQEAFMKRLGVFCFLLLMSTSCSSSPPPKLPPARMIALSLVEPPGGGGVIKLCAYSDHVPSWASKGEEVQGVITWEHDGFPTRIVKDLHWEPR